MTRRLALAVGDTAGHVNPALAIANTFARLFPGTDIHFFAAGDGPGHWLIERAGYPLVRVRGSAIARATRREQAGALLDAVQGMREARVTLARRGCRMVIGTGGFGSAAALLAARSLRLGTALVEPNVEPGLANRLLGHVVERAYIGFAETARWFTSSKPLLVGIPTGDRFDPTTLTRIPPSLPEVHVLVTSGSRGAEFFSERAPALMADLRARGLEPHVTHQAGADTDTVRATYHALGIRATVVPFLDDLPATLRTSDLVIARAGAGTIAELLCARVPTVLVPLGDAAHDHQTVNARLLAGKAAAYVVSERSWNSRSVAETIETLVRDAARWSRMVEAMAQLARPDATDTLVRDCEQLMKGRW